MIQLIDSKINPEDLKARCRETFKYFVKFVVDIELGRMAVGGELHADGEEMLLERGSKQDNLWGGNYYPENKPEERIEFEAFINIRPRLDNDSMEIKNETVRSKVRQWVTALLLGPDESLTLTD